MAHQLPKKSKAHQLPKMTKAHQLSKKTKRTALGIGGVTLLAGLNAPAAIGFAE
jgi:hypothetical protein